jgi:hypothetical protein
MELDPRNKGMLPSVDPPRPFQSGDGRFRGWKVTLPGRHPLATPALAEPIVYQPAVVDGRVYVGTEEGSLICLQTGDNDDHGWFIWGADAAHNGCLD